MAYRSADCDEVMQQDAFIVYLELKPRCKIIARSSIRFLRQSASDVALKSGIGRVPTNFVSSSVPAPITKLMKKSHHNASNPERVPGRCSA